MEVEVAEFEDAGERVLVHGRIRSRGIASGVELDTPVSWVCALREDKVVRVEAFLDRGAAEAAARD
jgi:ketosteroid isomerase-like protein